MKVMHVVGALNPGGAQTMFLATLHAMHASGRTENVGYVISDEAPCPESPLIRRMRLPSSPMLPLAAAFAILSVPFLVFAMRRERPDAVYAYHGTATILAAALAAKLAGTKMAARSFGVPEHYRPVERMLWRIIPSLCDAVVVLSEGCRSRLGREGVPAEKVRLIRNGKESTDGGITREGARALLGIRRGGLVIGMAGRITPMKNQASVVRMLPGLLSIRKDITLAVAGAEEDPEYARRIRSIVSADGTVRNCAFLGYREDMGVFFRACDIFVHPSRAEAGPGVVIEAMMAGLPVACFPVGDSSAMLGKCGFLCRNEVEMKSALARLVTDAELRKSAGEKAKMKAAWEYGAGRMAAEYEGMFFSLAKGVRGT